MKVPRRTRHCRDTELTISSEASKRIFNQLTDENVPIELSVPFLIRARGWRIQAFCREIGIHRAYLHALLQRQYEASFDIRYAVYKRLGFDPWQEAQPAGGEESTSQAISRLGSISAEFASAA